MGNAQIQNDAQLHVQIHARTHTHTQTFDQPAIGSLLEEPNHKYVHQFGFLWNLSYGLNKECVFL